MDLDTIRDYCLMKNAVTEAMPFDDCVLTFKVGGKIFALMNICELKSINLKYPSEGIDELRANYLAVKPGYHMSKKHWNTIELAETDWEKLSEWIDVSYNLIWESLPKKLRETLG